MLQINNKQSLKLTKGKNDTIILTIVLKPEKTNYTKEQNVITLNTKIYQRSIQRHWTKGTKQV